MAYSARLCVQMGDASICFAEKELLLLPTNTVSSDLWVILKVCSSNGLCNISLGHSFVINVTFSLLRGGWMENQSDSAVLSWRCVIFCG